MAQLGAHAPGARTLRQFEVMTMASCDEQIQRLNHLFYEWMGTMRSHYKTLGEQQQETIRTWIADLCRQHPYMSECMERVEIATCFEVSLMAECFGRPPESDLVRQNMALIHQLQNSPVPVGVGVYTNGVSGWRMYGVPLDNILMFVTSARLRLEAFWSHYKELTIVLEVVAADRSSGNVMLAEETASEYIEKLEELIAA